MRKFFSLIAAVLFAGSMMASEAIMQYTGGVTTNMVGDGANNAATVGLDADLFTVLAEKGANQNLPGLNKANDIRLYADRSTGNGNTITVSIASGTINSIVLDIKQTATFVVKAGETAVTEEDGAYAINATSFSIQNTTTGATTQLQLNKITITYTAEGGVTPPADTYTVAGNDAAIFGEAWNPALTANDMTLANGIYKWEKANLNLTAGTIQFKVVKNHSWDIAYPAQNYELNIAEAGEYTLTITFDPSNEAVAAEAVKKEAPAAISCLEVYQKAKNDAVLLNPVTVTYSNGANVWVMDGSASMLIYLPSGFTNNFQAGDVLSGIAGVVDIYQNIVYEVKPDATQAAAIVATPGEAPAPSQAAVIEASDVNKYVILPGFSIEGAFTADSKTSLPAVLGENTVTIYNNFKFAYTFEAGKTYDIIGVVSAYKGNPQVYFISAEEAGGEVPPTPSVNYYVAGSMNGWAANEAYILTPNNENLYEGEFTFAANDEFKVIGFDGETTTWFPEGMGNNFQITEAGDYKITFNPAGNVEGWYEGFFNVVKKEAPIVHQYEVAEAIAAGLQENEEILVRGVITKMEFKGANFAKFGSVNIYVADATDAEGEFEFFNCYSLNADTFRTSIPNYDPTDKTWAQFNEVADENGNTIHVGDTVIAFGKYKLYNSTHELNTGCYLVDIKHAPVAPADTIKLDFNTENTTYAFVDNQYFSEYGTTDIYLSDINVNASTHMFEGDGNYLVLDFYPEDANNVTGVYKAHDDETLDLEYTYMLTINGTDTAVVEFADGAIQVEIGEVNKELGMAQLALAGQLISTEGDIYAITALVIAYYDFLPEEGVEDVVIDPKAIKRIVNGQVVIEKAGKSYNMNGAVIR